MKAKSALKQSTQAAKLYAISTALAALVAAVWPHWISFTVLGVSLFSLAMDVINIIAIRRKAKSDPSTLEQDVS